MHRALAIEDIVRLIGEYQLVEGVIPVRSSDAFHFALTCSGIWVVIKPLLWRYTSITWINYLLPVDLQLDLHTTTSEHPFIERDLTEVELQRVLYYCRDIRILSVVDLLGTYQISLFYLLQAYRYAPQAFNIVDVRIYFESETSIALCPDLIFAGLASLEISLYLPSTLSSLIYDIACALSTRIAERCIHLQRFTILLTNLGYNHNESFRPALRINNALQTLYRSLTELRIVKISPVTAKSSLWSELANLSMLEELEARFASAFEPDTLIISDHAFPKLRRLDLLLLHEPTPIDTARLVLAVSSPSLQHLRFTVLGYVSMTTAFHILAERWGNTLSSLRVEVRGQETQRCIVQSDLRSLLGCTLLEKLHLDTSSPLDLDDSDVKRFTASWPRLKHLKLHGHQPGQFGSNLWHWTPRTTISSLRIIRDRLPDLAFLTLAVNFDLDRYQEAECSVQDDNASLPTGSLSQASKLADFELGPGTVCNEPHRAVECIKEIFPMTHAHWNWVAPEGVRRLCTILNDMTRTRSRGQLFAGRATSGN